MFYKVFLHEKKANRKAFQKVFVLLQLHNCRDSNALRLFYNKKGFPTMCSLANKWLLMHHISVVRFYILQIFAQFKEKFYM